MKQKKLQKRKFSNIITLVMFILSIILFSFACSKEKKILTAKVTFTLGQVQQILPDGKVKKVKVGDTLLESYAVKTGKKGTLDILIGETSVVRVKSNTEIKISQLTKTSGERTQLSLSVGSLLIHPKKLRKNDSFTVKTPTAVAGVRGTKFIIEAKEDATTRVSVSEGKVFLKKILPALENADQNKILASEILSDIQDNVEAGDIVEVGETGVINGKQVKNENEVIKKMLGISSQLLSESGKTKASKSLQIEIDARIQEELSKSFVKEKIIKLDISKDTHAEEVRKSLDDVTATKQIKTSNKEKDLPQLTQNNNKVVNKTAWSKKISKGAIKSNIAYYHNMIIFGDNDGNINALNEYTGKLVWHVRTGYSISASPIVSNGIVYIPVNDENLYAINAKIGKVLWKRNIGTVLYSCQPVIHNNHIYLGTAYGDVVAVSKKGKIIWKVSVGAGVFTSAYVSNETVFVGAEDNKLYALNEKTGKIKWSFETQKRIIASSPIVYKNKVYIGSYDKKLYALKIKNGDKVWVYDTKGMIGTTPILHKGTLIITNASGKVIKINAENKKLIWSKQVASTVSTHPKLYKGKLFVASPHKVFVIDVNSGEVLFDYDVKNTITSSPRLSKDKIFVTTNKGEVIAFKYFDK